MTIKPLRLALCATAFSLCMQAGWAGGLKDWLASGSKPEAVRVRDKWALLIGVGQFQDPAVPAKKESAGVRAVNDILLSPYGKFPADHVYMLTGKHATKDGITRAAADWLQRKALPDDIVFVYVSSYLAKGKHGEPLVFCYDTLGSEPELSALDLQEYLTTLKARTQSRLVLCTLDASPAPGTQGADVLELSKCGVSLISATDGHQKSQVSSSGANTVFGERLCESLKSEGGALTIHDAYAQIASAFRMDEPSHPAQTPMFIAAESSPIGDLSIGVPVKSSAPPPSFSIGHPVNRLAIDHPDLIAPNSVGLGGHAPKAKPPATDSQEDNDKAVDFSSYMTKMKSDIQSHWQPPKGLEARRVVAAFSIEKDGRIVDAHLVEGSGIAEIDKSALEALKAASPLSPLPKGAPESVDIKYKFEWKVNPR